MKMHRRSGYLIGGLVVLLLALVAGAVLAQTATQDVPADEDALSLGRAWRGHFGSGHEGFGRSGEHEEYLADALGITLEELQAARARAAAAYLADAVAAGEITQEQADLMLARRALSGIVDHKSLLAEALGMTAEELAAALSDGQSLSDLMTAQGLTADTLQENVQAAYEAAVARAVADGTITQAQADAVLAQDNMRFHFFFDGRGMDGRHGRHGGRGGSWSLPSLPDSGSDSEDTTTDTGFDA